MLSLNLPSASPSIDHLDQVPYQAIIDSVATTGWICPPVIQRSITTASIALTWPMYGAIPIAAPQPPSDGYCKDRDAIPCLDKTGKVPCAENTIHLCRDFDRRLAGAPDRMDEGYSLASADSIT